MPHRSLPPRGFHLLMLILGLISLAVGIGFVSIGAWPVIGFFGLDVALVYLAFRLNYRSARRSETIRLAGDAFTVERVSVRGERRMWRFQPFWLRVILEERGDEGNRLLVASHGRSLVIGDFVTPAARRELAAAIREALSRWRDALNPARRGNASETEHLLQAIETRRPADDPARRLHRTFRVDGPARRPVDQLEALAGSGKDHMVVADRIAAAQCHKADVAGAARASDAVPPALLHFFEHHLAARRYRTAEGERRARRGIDLAAMVHLHDFDVPIRTEPAGDLFDETRAAD